MAQQYQATPPATSRNGHGTSRPGRGWRTFAGVMFIGAAAANALWGVAALVNDDYFRVDELLFGDLSMWGVFYLCFAALYLIVGILILRRSSVGMIIGVGIALLHFMLALFSIAAEPFWTAAVLLIDGLIIYGLTVHGLEDEDWAAG
jgi:hypothetical protein